MGLRHFVTLLVLAAALCPEASLRAKDKLTDTPESLVGERLFLETRFSQYYARRSLGDANAVFRTGDPIVETGANIGGALPGPFAGKSVNCRSCHLVDEQAAFAGNRTYCDFARRSPVPERGDGLTTTARNSPGLVGVFSKDHEASSLHFDGEFATPEDLVVEGFTGRNFGWLPSERRLAVKQIAHVLRGDDGAGLLARGAGGSYARVLLGEDDAIPARVRLSPEFRIDVTKATDEELLAHVARLVTVYLRNLDFTRDRDGLYSGSPYDRFLKFNALPRRPDQGESPRAYGRRLIALISGLDAPRFVSASEGRFTTMKRDFVFGPKELKGLKIFFTELDPAAIPPKSVGNCVACHTPPSFSDFKYHNTGATQEAYDEVHGAGAFAALRFPTQAERLAHPDAFLPRSTRHPYAEDRFLSAVDSEKPGRTDLGLWNIFANPDHPKPQAALRAIVADPAKKETDDELLAKTLAAFKTPSIRDPDQSGPYLHDGAKDSIEQVVRFYRDTSAKSRVGAVRNADPEIARIFIAPPDEAPLAAFLRSLDEDYQ